MLDEARKGVLSEPCFWLRGLVPAAWTHVSAAKDDDVLTFLRSHPPTTDRIGHTQGLINASALPGDLRITDNGQLELIQRRIELLGEARR